VHAEDAQLTEPLRKLARDPRLLEPVAGVRRDPVGHEGADGVADVPLLVRQEVVDVQEVLGVELHPAAVRLAHRCRRLSLRENPRKSRLEYLIPSSNLPKP
jgi:hypothetical protein